MDCLRKPAFGLVHATSSDATRMHHGHPAKYVDECSRVDALNAASTRADYSPEEEARAVYPVVVQLSYC